MSKIIIEIGSTATKIDLFDGNKVKRIETKTIEFKKNYKIENKLYKKDVETLISKVNELQKQYNNIYVCGTSIFRVLENKEKEEFLNLFKNSTNIDFEIISQEKESELTVIGAIKGVSQRVAVMIGGGGSTEIVIYENGIKEKADTSFGVSDIIGKYPDLAGDIATTDLETVKKLIKEKLNLPTQKADILILAGGGHKYFAENSGFNYETNNLYKSELAPICMDIETRKRDTLKYYTQTSLDEIRKNSNDPNWWNATRAMTAVSLVLAEKIDAKYIVPTDISMVYGLI